MEQAVETAQRALKHVVVREYVRDLLDGAEPGTPAPSERELVSHFKVARMTVRQALDALVAEGLLERMPGRGTFVARPRRRAARLTSFTEDMRRRGMSAESRTLLARVEKAGPGVARALEIAPHAPVLHWKRLRRAGGSAICLEDAYLNEAMLPGFLAEGLPTSLYDALQSRQLRPTWAEDAVQADVANPEEAELLGLDAGRPVLRLARRALCGERVVQVSRSTYRSDRFTLHVQLGDDTP
ncbi:GntR family transcriptional regulator [Nocardioides campestrisoli]|uniref:GntR family transcriptional regulator n=1 Tax=Nocardioides campestrisoli TaxID=2736757 RepID=UPI001CD765B2|nr:GntR family transcriptional regulator [Nocardioides campestrisoli]